MRKWHVAAALATLATIPVLAAGCEAPPLGELVLIIKTDMAPPKDFNKMRIEVFNEGQLKFQFEGPVPGDPGEEQRIVLPSTLGLVAPTDPSNSIRIEVGVRSGGKEGPVRVVREVVTTIPPDRVAMLNIPIQFLCKKDDIPFDNNGNLKSDCPEGKTCLAGSCVDNKVDSSKLPDYNPDAIFGGSDDPAKGTCFDVATCFEEAELIDETTLDTDACTFAIPAGFSADELNFALGVESDGICNGRGCFVVLDAKTETGWQVAENKTDIVLPKGVCENLTAAKPSGLKVLQVVSALVSGTCPQKDTIYPTCGPWSAVEQQNPPGPKPTSIAGAQDHPISVSVLGTADGAFAYWTNGGGSIKGTSLEGGALVSIDSVEPPRDILVTEKALLWTTANDDLKVASVYAALANAEPGTPPVQLHNATASLHEGIALSGSTLLWTVAGDPGTVKRGTLSANFGALTNVTDVSANNAYPYRIVADKKYAYWTNEGTFMDQNGSVARAEYALATPATISLTATVGTPIIAPRAIAIDVGADGLATDCYFAAIGDGKVWRIPNASSDAPGEPEAFASGLSAPNGIAIGEKYVFIANRVDGTIVYKSKDDGPAVKPTVLATGQKNPGTILVNGNTLIWVNEGPSASDAKEGSIVKYDISNL